MPKRKSGFRNVFSVIFFVILAQLGTFVSAEGNGLRDCKVRYKGLVLNDIFWAVGF